MTTKPVEPSQSLPLTDSEAAGMREALKLQEHKGEIHVGLCPLCTRAEWLKTHETKPTGMVVTVNDAPCPYCQNVARLHPAIFEWFTTVLSGQSFLAELRYRSMGELKDPTA
jgi:hypothetical protein